MLTFSIKYKTLLTKQMQKSDVKADSIKEAVQKLKEQDKNILVISFIQI